MNTVFVAVLFSNTVLAFSFLIMCLQRHSNDRLEKILAFVTASSMFWSLGAGLLVVQNDDFWAQMTRCLDLFGTVSFMVSIIMLLNCIAENKGRLYTLFHFFSLLGYVLVIFSFFTGIYTFTKSNWGMSFRFKNQVYGYFYVAFFVLCVVIMLYYLVNMLKSEKKSITFFGKTLLFMMIIIILGIGSDMILPFFGSPSAPGSSISQFWALVIVWYAADNISHSRLTVKNMSHEIRTPVNAIVGFSDVALAENPPERIKEYLIDIKNASGTLLSSINDILNISKIESGKMEIVNEEYSFRRLLKNVTRIISVQAADFCW